MVATNADSSGLTTQQLTPAFALAHLPFEYLEKGPPWHPNAAGWLGCVIASLCEVRGPFSSYLIPDNERHLAGELSTCGYNSRFYRLSSGPSEFASIYLFLSV